MSEFTNESVVAIESSLNEVDEALERLRLGTYRTCQICSAPLDDTALEANPLLSRCGDHLELA
jgi:RNA polymerase-binding transcription factor DksA